jgi:hypothetical protein
VNRIASICGFKGMLAEALGQFLKALNSFNFELRKGMLSSVIELIPQPD